MKTSKLIMACFFSMASTCFGSEAISALQVIENVNSVPECQNMTRNLSMKLINKRGKERKRETISYRKNRAKKRDMVLTFLSPANIRGTALLTYDYHDAQAIDDQWIYLPALRKPRRISAANRGDYFLGTDFTYEDTKKEGKIEKDDFSFSLREQESTDYFLVEALPASDKIARELGYGKIHIRVAKSNWLVTHAMYWDLKLRKLKEVTFDGDHLLDGIWVRSSILANNVKTGHRTEFHFSNIDCETTIDDSMFRREALADPM